MSVAIDKPLAELLDDFQAYIIAWRLHCHFPPTSSPPDEVAAARRAIESAFSKLETENQRLRTVYSVCPNCDTSWTNGEVEAEHNRLRSLGTPE
jgi:hypothetical protein